MAWIQVHQTLKDHRKVYAAADALDVDPAHALGLIVSFWLWALDNAPSGSLDGISNRMIARAAQWTGDADEFVEALKTAEFVDETQDGGLELHDWQEYTGSLIEKREAEKQRSRKRRAAAKEQPADAAALPPSWAQTTAGQTEDKPQSDHQKTAGRVEKSRVEKSRVEIGGNPPISPDAVSERFALFWKAYPKKVGKGAAEKAWKKIKPSAELFDTIMAAIDAAKASEQWQRENGRYIPNPATWLNQSRWEDELPAAAQLYSQPPAGGKGGKPNTMDVLAGIIAAEEGGAPV